MKKIFTASKSSALSSGQPNELINTANLTISQQYAHFIGQKFQLAKHSVCVEEVIAEGWHTLFSL